MQPHEIPTFNLTGLSSTKAPPLLQSAALTLEMLGIAQSTSNRIFFNIDLEEDLAPTGSDPSPKEEEAFVDAHGHQLSSIYPDSYHDCPNPSPANQVLTHLSQPL